MHMTEVPDDPPAGAQAAAAEVAPLDVDGVRAVAIGTALWALALIALVPFRSTLSDDGHLWWIGTCAVGVLLGLAGLAYVTRLRSPASRK